MKATPLSSFLRANLNLLRGRVRFPRERIGETIEYEGQIFTIFREMHVDQHDNSEPQASFIVRFHVKNMSPQRNILFSWLAIPFFSGLPGFRSKLWLLDEQTGDNLGMYEWATVADARAYSQSFAMRFMSARSSAGSARFDIIARPDQS